MKTIDITTLDPAEARMLVQDAEQLVEKSLEIYNKYIVYIKRRACALANIFKENPEIPYTTLRLIDFHEYESQTNITVVLTTTQSTEHPLQETQQTLKWGEFCMSEDEFSKYCETLQLYVDAQKLDIDS